MGQVPPKKSFAFSKGKKMPKEEEKVEKKRTPRIDGKKYRLSESGYIKS